jgi:ketosteroid isomerase-like protein
MKRLVTTLSFIAILAAMLSMRATVALSSVLQQPQKPEAERPLSAAEREVRKLERDWLDAYEQHDVEAMNRIVADEFKLTFPDGGVQTKADILRQLKSGRQSGFPSPKFSTEDVQSLVEGDTVILKGRFIQKLEHDGHTQTMQLRYNDTYSKREGRWQVIASQLSSIQPQ